MIAKVIKITEKPTAKGGIYYNLVLDVEGKKLTLNSFQAVDNATFQQAFDSGASVDITTSKNEKGYDQIDAVSLVPGTAPAEKPIPQSATVPDRQFKADPEKQASIELQHYTSDVKDLWIAGKLTDKSPLVEKYMFILSRKIGCDLNTLTPEPAQSPPMPLKDTKPVNTQVNPQPGPVSTTIKTYSITHLVEIIKKLGEMKLPGWDKESVMLHLITDCGSKGQSVTECIKNLTPEEFVKYDLSIKGYEKTLLEPKPGDGIF